MPRKVVVCGCVARAAKKNDSGCMPNTDPNKRAAAHLKATLSRCVNDLIDDLERGGRAHMALPCMAVEGRAQVEMADKLREQARKAGL